MKKSLLFVVFSLWFLFMNFDALGQIPTLYGFSRGGKLFKFLGDGSSFVTIGTCTGTQSPGHLMQASNGLIYGMSGSGQLFNVDPSNDQFTVLHTFGCVANYFCTCPPPYPYPRYCSIYNGNLVEGKDGILYGNLWNTLFSYDLTSNAITIYSPGISNGEGIFNLVMADNGKIYMATSDYHGYGHLCSFDTSSQTYSILTSSTIPPQNLLKGKNGMLYCTMDNKDILSFNTATNAFGFVLTLISPEIYPEGLAISENKQMLYGTIQRNTIYSFNLLDNTYTRLRTFDSNPDSLGKYPGGSIILASDCKIFGMIHTNGFNRDASFFSFDITNNTYTKILDGSYSTVQPYEVDQLLEVNPGHCSFSMISEKKEDIPFSIFPNPATNPVTITIDENMLNSTATITDITGRKMAAVQLQTLNYKLETANFANGVYFISLENERGRVTKKLVIQK
ncbi:MAG: T9SS type A sorting domain-containing protein [Bacteroidetes bacterium]|nr:T9SS type A sorting domain-containing protein [Bacteroidota bacterium]